MASEILKEYNLALHVKLSNKPEQHHVSFTAVRDLKPETEWVALRDFDDFEELENTDKILLLDCTSVLLSNSLATLSPKNRVLAVLCVCRTVSEQELKMSVDEMASVGYPPLLFLLEKSPDVIKLKELLLINPYDVECTILEEQCSWQLSTSDAYPSYKNSDDGGPETFPKVNFEAMGGDTLESILFTKKGKHDQVPLVICKNPYLFTLIVNLLHQKVDKVTKYSPQSKKELKGVLNKIAKYLKNEVICNEHVQVDWPLYLMIFSEINSFYDSTKENQALEAMEFILGSFLKVPPDVIATSIRYFANFSQDNAFKLRKIDNLDYELIQLFNTQFIGKAAKHHRLKQISMPQDLETKLLWYNVIVLCNQCFKMPGHSRWFEDIIQCVEYDKLSVFEYSTLNSVRVYGIEFGLKLSLSFEQRFLLSTLMRWVSVSIHSFTFHNFNTVLEFILRWEYEVTEIVDFISSYLLFITEFIRSRKATFDYLLQENLKASVHIQCIIMSNLATLTCTANTRDVQAIDNKSGFEICRKYWLDIFKLILNNIIHYFQDKLYNPEEFALLMRNFYDLIKIPTSPESLIKPWIREYKKEVIVMVVRQSHRYDIKMFHEILKIFSVNLLSRIAIDDYFFKYQPSSKVDLKEVLWDDLLQIIFAIKDPPKSIFVTLRRIFEKYSLRNSGYEFICDCLSLDLPPYGKEYVPTEKEDKNIPSFMSVIERECRQSLRIKIHENLLHLLDLIPKLRFPSLLHVTILDPLCRAIVPDQSLLSYPDKLRYCKSLIISLETISHYQTQKLTLEQLKTSNQHYYLWRILSAISRGLRFDRLEYSKFPYMVITLLLIYDKFDQKLHGFGDYAWEDKNLNSFIEYCKRSSSIVHKQHEEIMEGNCTLLECTEIANNLQNLNQLFKNCHLPSMDTEVIQEKMKTFAAITEEMKTILFLQLEIENEMKFTYLPVFLEENQTNVPEGIRREIEVLFSIHHAQHINKQNKIVSIPSITPSEVILLNEFHGRCQIVIDSFKMFSRPLFENSKSSVHEFLAHFALRENVLFTVCLHKCQQDKLSSLKGANSVPHLSMDQFVESLTDCYQLLTIICEGKSTYSEIENINQNLKLESLDFTKIQADINKFAPLGEQMGGVIGVIGVMDLFQLLKIAEYLHHITDVCEQYTLTGCIESKDYKQLHEIVGEMRNEQYRNNLTISMASSILADVNAVTNNMPIQRYLLFPILTGSIEFYKFLREKKLYDNRESFDYQVNLITSEKQDEDYDDTILSHLSIAYNYMLPLFDKNQSFKQFHEYYSNMNIGTETGYSQLKSVNNNIMLIRRWFILAEGDTTENVSQQLQDILETGKYEIVLGNPDRERDFESMPSLPNYNLKIRKHSPSILLKYSASTKIAPLHQNRRDSCLPHSVPSSPTLLNANPPTFKAALSRIEERMNTDKIDEFVRKLGFQEQSKLSERRIANIADFQHFHNTMLGLFEVYLELTSLGHPEYQENVTAIPCNTTKDHLKEIFDYSATKLTEWKERYTLIQQNTKYLLFFPIQRIITTVSLMEAKAWNRAANQVSFLFNHDFRILRMIKTNLMDSFNTVKKQFEDSHTLVSPAEVMSSIITILVKDKDLKEELLIQDKASTAKPTRRDMRDMPGTMIVLPQTIQRAYGFSQSDVLSLIQSIYQNRKIDSFQLLHCNANTSFEELSLFLDRTTVFTNCVYSLIEVNKLPNLLQEHTMKHITESQKPSQSIAQIHYIETAQSLLHELPGIRVNVSTKPDKLNPFPPSLVFDRIVLVYGLEGNGKTHYIRNMIKDSPHLVFSINEAFSVPAIIEKMNQNIILNNARGLCIYFNFTITCLLQEDKASKDYSEYLELMSKVNWFFFDFLVLNHISDSSSSLIFRVPSGMNWKLYIEVPSRPASLLGREAGSEASAKNEDPRNNLSEFQLEIPIFKTVGKHKEIGYELPYEIDTDVQLICKYLKAYYDFEITKDEGIKSRGINRLYTEKKRIPVRFSAEKDLNETECSFLLGRYMEKHVQTRKILQKLFVRYMLRRCNVLEHLPYFTFNTGTGIIFDNERQVYTDTKQLGSTLMRIMIFEVNKFCDPTCKEDWSVHEHQQLIYNTSGGGHPIKFLSLNPNMLDAELRKDLKTLGIIVPNFKELGTRNKLEELLAHALSLESTDISELINEEEFVLTVDFLLKMLNIHERRMCRCPVVIVGETGVGKTKLLEFLSKLWNKATNRAYYKTVDAIIDIIKKNISQILSSGPNQPESGILGALTSLNEAISSRRQPPEDSVLKACEILYQDFSRPLETFCRMPAFHLFLIDHHIAETAIRFQSPENTARFLIALLSAKPMETFIKINVHSAVTPTDIKCKFTEIFEKAELLSKPLIPSERPIDHTSQVPIVTVFLDEINTSSCPGLFKEIVIDGYIDGEKIPDNVFIVAACNPHRSVTATLQVDTKVEDWVLGWYYVRKLHPTLSRILWDYGALNKHQEHEYIQQKFCVSHIQNKIKGIDLSNISAQIAKAQKLVRKFAKSQLIKVGFATEEAEIRSKSCVSQRDIQRVFKITDFLNSIRREEINERTALDITQESVIVAIGLVYYFRLDEHFRKEFSTKLDTKFGLRFVAILNNYVDEFVNVVKIPSGIAKTKALKENLFATLICTMSKIPLIIVGAPGTSKTLSFNLAISNIKGAESPKEYFRNPKFPALEPHYYQCSRRSTSTEIENVFKIAIKRQETHNAAELKIFPVVFMGKTCLAEESHESLKALHHFLDRPKVSFVAISNHILDAATSNRAINLFRPQQQDDLLTLAQGCFLKSAKSFDHTTPSRQFISRICKSYENLMENAVFSKFYGLRDFIHMIGYLRRNRDHQNEKYLLRAVERNFNGQDKSCFKKVATEFVTEEVYCENARTIIEILRESLADRSIRPQTRRSKDGEEGELVEVRYKMIIDPSEDDSLTRLLYHYNILNIEDTRMFIGSDFPGDGELQKVILISAIKHAASEGKTVILSKADGIYENFYDLFNQNYRQVEDEKGRRYYANIAIGSHSKPCRVDPNFQCIVRLHKSFLKDAPQPFLNRFEKFHVSQNDLLQASIDALPPCMKIVVKSAINQVRNFIRAVKIETFYGDIEDSFESLLIDMLPKPGFDYEAIKKKLKSMRPSELNGSLDPDAMHDDDDDDDMNKPYPPSHQYLDLMLSQLKKLAGFNFIYLPVEERNKIAVDILSTASKIEPVSNSEVENLSKVIRANPQNIEQFLSDAIELLMKENGPMDEDVALEKSLYLLPLRVLPGERLVIGMIAHFLIRYLCVRLLQLALPEALIVKFDQLSHTFKQTYLVHQDHFEFKKLVSKYVELQDESRDIDLNPPTKLICYTRTTSFILSLPNEYTSTFNPSISSTVHADVEELIPMAGESRAESNISLFKLSAIKTQDQFMTILRDFFNHPTKRVLLFIADMQHITQQRINFVRIMIDEEESVASTKIGADNSLNKLVVILMHYPPSIFNRTPLKTGTTSLSRYPAHFLHGWDHCYLDNLQKSKENSPLSIQEWISLTLLDQKDRLKSIERTMLRSLTDKLPTLTDNILSRIIFGTSVHCVFNSDTLTHNDRSKLMESIFVETDIYQIMCEMFTTYFDYTFIQKQIHSYANSIFQNLSNLSLSDLVVTSFWNFFTSFLTLMTYKINEGLNLEVLFDHSIQGMEFNQENVKLFEDILRLISKPIIEEIENISHILDSQVKKVVHLPKFPFSSYIVRAFDNAIQSSIQEVNKNMTINTTRAKSSQGANKLGSEDLNKLLIENLVSNIDKYPLIKYTMSIIDQNLWLSYLEDFAYSHLSLSATSQLWKQEHSKNFVIFLIRFWGYEFDQKDIANSLLKLHVSSFSNSPDFSKLLFIFSSLERLTSQPELEPIKNPNMMSVILFSNKQRSLSLYSYFITMLYDSVVKISVRPSAKNLNIFKSWVSVYLILIIQLSGSSQPNALDYNLPEDQKLTATFMHSLYLVGKYHYISPEFLRNAFDLAIFVRLQPKGTFELIPVFNKALEQITDTCQDTNRPEIARELKTEFAEGVLHHHIEVNRQIDEEIICWILRSANTQFVWSATAVKYLHPHSKTSKETEGGSDQLIEPGILTFRSFQYLITRFLTNASDQEEGEKLNDITLFNKQVKHLIASELLSAQPVRVPSEYVPFYYDLGGKFMKCSAETQLTMKQPLAHLYYHIALDRLIQLHGEKELVSILKLFTELIGTNLGYELSPEETVISRIEKQALFQVILRSYSKHFKPNPSSTVLHYIERNPDCIVEIQKHIDDHNFGGGALGGHSWTMLYLVSKKCLSMEIFENYLEQLKLSKDELPWLYKCISKLERIERKKTPQFPFANNIKDKRYKSYKECYELMRSIASADSADEAGKKIDELSNLVKKSQEMPYLRLYIWLGVYQEFYLKGISSVLLYRAIDSKRFKTLELSEGKKRILFAFLNPQRMVRSMELSEPLNPDTPVYEMEGAKLHLKERTDKKKDYLFEFFSLDQKDPDDVILRNILSNLIAVFIALPNDTTHLSAFFLDTETLRDTYVVSNLYPKPISQAIRYDCGCELNEDGSYGRPDYYSFDRKSFTLHSFYLMTLMNFGALSVNLISQPNASESVSSALFSKWKPVRHYCLSQIRTIWLHMQLRWQLTQEELGEFLTNCFYDFYKLALEPASPLQPTLFKSTKEVLVYESYIHRKVYEENLRRIRELRADIRTASQQEVISEFSCNVISFRKWYPPEITFSHLQHTIESYRPVDTDPETSANTFAILHRFISERKRFRISSILIPNLIKLYRIFHSDLSFFLTRKDTETKTIDQVISKIKEKCRLFFNVDIQNLYERIRHFYNEYVKVCRGLIGFGPCAAIRREEKFGPLNGDTKFIRLLSLSEEPEVGFDALYLVIHDLITTQNEFLDTVAENKKTLPWLRSLELETSAITPTEENTRNAFVSDLTPNEINHYWTSMDQINENSLEIFELIRSRTTYTPFQERDTCPYDLNALEQDIFWKYIASKPMFNIQSTLKHKLFRFKEIIVSNIPDPLNLQQFLTQVKNYLSDQSEEYLTPLSDTTVKNLEYHFHTLEYGDFCRLLNALRQTLQRLAQSSITMSEEDKLNMNLAAFLMQHASKYLNPRETLVNAGFIEFSGQQLHILGDIKVNTVFSCTKFFLNKFNSRSYDFCRLPYCVKTPLDAECAARVEQLGAQLTDKLRSIDVAKNELEQLLTTLHHCEQTFIQTPQDFIKKTLTDYQFYDATDKVIQLFPDKIQNAHYVSLIGSLQSCMIQINSKLAERLEQRKTATNEWTEHIKDFWSLLPHFCESDAVEGDVADGFDYDVIQAEDEPNYQAEGGASYDYGIL